MTKYMKKILEIVQTSYAHLTAEQVFQELRKTYPTVAMATVYNNLSRLREEGQIRKVSVEGMPDRYDRAARHDHLVCRNCGRLTDVDLEDLTEELERKAGFPILAYDLKLMYLCEACRKAREKEGR